MNAEHDARFETFRALHAGRCVLLLPNAWDAVSAALFADAGAKAIATSSAGLAWSCGYADGGALPPGALLAAAASVCAVSGELPVSVDIEDGYSADPDRVADLVARLRDIGVAGINLEDGSGAPELLTEKIAAVKQRLRREGRDVFINARTDVVLREILSGEEAIVESIARGRRYAAAGANAFFVPELSNNDAIARIASAVALPLSLMAVPGLATADALFARGVRRLSGGAAPAKLAYGRAREAAKEFLKTGDCQSLFGGHSVDYAATNALLRGGEH
ncbi:MAG: isocitrate lyase/phosphoenolpyruvate mutase family protein [Candidatus Eremiobacteraeota bacterium]|nr:isocitrate lyase/phosphoenolpyruvate mutase family protein [Candidatus Eremiobacteraeota bacterium]